MSNGMGYGTNAVASIITRGLVEMTRLGAAMVPIRSRFWGSPAKEIWSRRAHRPSPEITRLASSWRRAVR